MTAVLTGDPQRTAVVERWQDYRAALGEIATRLGATADLPTEAPAGPDPVSAAAGPSGMRSHRAPLAEARKRQPKVVLLATRLDGSPVLVTKSDDLAALMETCWVFHRRLPHDGLTGRKLLAFGLRGAGPVLAGTTTAGLLAALLTFVLPLGSLLVLSGILYDRSELVYIAGGSVLGALVVGWLAGLLRDLAVTRLQGRLQSTVEPAVWDRLLSAPLSFFRAHPVRKLLSYANGVSQLRALFGSTGLDAVLGAVFSGIAVALLAVVDLRIGLTALGVVLLLLLALAWLAWRQQRHDIAVYDGVDDVQALLYPALIGIDEIHAYSAEDGVFQRWLQAFGRQKKADDAGMRYAEVSAALISGTQPALVAVLVPLSGLVGAGLNGMLAASFAAIQLNIALSRLQGVLQGVFSVGPIHQRLRPILEQRPEIPPRATLAPELIGAIEMRAVSFTYPGATSPTLSNVSLKALPGQFIAVVGPSGAGKSTILRMLLGLDRPSSGTLLLDGHDMSTLDLEAVRGQIGYVPQDAKALRGDIRSVILGGTLEQGDHVAWEAAELAGIFDDIRGLPMGMDTRISDGQAGFSGGQLQRLLLARALAKKPRIVLLDEATSALDNSAQEHVSAAITALGLTRVVVAHRLSTIRAADHILVLEDGAVVQSGTYDELTTVDGRFRNLTGQRL